jgi:uncharacterized protein (TIGR00255 family)
MMSIRSMTGFAQVKGQAGDQLGFTLSLKSVNHRFLDLHLRMPPDSDALEMKLRRLLKEKLSRGHVDVALSMERAGGKGISLNRPLVHSYVEAFRAMARETGVAAEVDLNAILRLPGMLDEGGGEALGADFDEAVTAKLDEAIACLNEMRAEEGRSIARELRERLDNLRQATAEVEKFRDVVLRAYLDKIQTRMQELLAGRVDSDRILQEAALLAERSDIQEEIVRMNTHIQHFFSLLDQPGDVGKKLDFLLQEMVREANTLLSKTGGVAGEALRITELGLAMKSEIEKIREQVQNVE